MSLPIALALVDAAAGLYLLQYAVRRQRRNRDALIVTAVFLLVSAVTLAAVGLFQHAAGPLSLPAVIPAGDAI